MLLIYFLKFVSLVNWVKKAYSFFFCMGFRMLNVYTDGSCLGNPGPGGWGFVLYDGTVLVTEQSGGEKHTTNNRMELLAAICALDYCMLRASYQTNPDAPSIASEPDIIIHTDSQYVKNGITQWLTNWVANGWRSRSGAVKNQDLWEQLHELNQTLNIKWEWVRGHDGNEGNERADILCTTAAKTIQNREKGAEKRQHTIQTQKQRVYLSVPFAQKEEAKKLGARWDADKKKWYCDAQKANAFSAWIEK